MGFAIQHAQSTHANAIAELFNQYRIFCKQNGDLALAQSFISERLKNKDSVIFFAQNDVGDYLGFTQLYPTFSSISAQRSWVLNDLFVTETAREKGVATALMNTAYEHAKRTGAKGLALATAKDNVQAKALYENLGYALDTSFDHYFLSTATEP